MEDKGKQEKIKQNSEWILLLMAALLLLVMGITGRLAILLGIAFTPDNVAYLGSNT